MNVHSIRLATEADIPTLETLITASVRALQPPFYSPRQIEGALGSVFALDRQLIRDETYFVVEADKEIVGCGGWSKRSAAYGGDQGRSNEEPLLNPATDPARIRAFFVRPDRARQGIGRSILLASESAVCDAGFHKAVLVATLAGEPLYAALGYTVAERFDVTLKNNISLPVVRMGKVLRA